LELTLTNLARFAEALAGVPSTLTAAERRLVRTALVAVRDGDLGKARQAAAALDEAASRRPLAPLAPGGQGGPGAAVTGWPPGGAPAPPGADVGVILRRLAGTVDDYCGAAARWGQLEAEAASAPGPGDGRPGVPPDGVGAAFEPAVTLDSSGALPGARDVSAQVAAAGDGRLRHLAPATRAGIQTAVAVGASAVAGDALSPSRFYWAVLAAFISFLGVSHSLEQVRKAFHRVIGTLAGVILGSLLAGAAGHRTAASLAVILVFLFLGTYLFNVNYTFMAIAITVVVSQLYVTLGEFSDPLLLLRLEETAIGAVIAMLTGILVVPVRTRQVAGAAVAAQVRATAALVGVVAGGGDGEARRHAARAVDSAYQVVLSATQPMRWTALGDLHRRLVTTVAAAGAARNYSRNLVVDFPPAPDPPPPGLSGAVDGLVGHMEALAEVAAGSPPAGRHYVRSASVLARVPDAGGPHPRRWVLAIRDLQLLDGALARLAEALGMAVTSLDVPDRPGVAAGARR
ncbi:MAG TPA: FUSC family protein, partial [Acidimicrobiales bacterium]|nr:FUSC family protein [Acidimicrobiales bacterium]